MKRIIATVLMVTFLLSLISCGKIKDPLAENPELMENITNNWMPILSEEECLETMGLGNSKDTQSIITRERCHHYGNCVYFWDYTMGYEEETGKPIVKRMLQRYDLRNGQTYPVCRDSACLHDSEACSFFSGNISWFVIVDNMIYLLWAEDKSGNEDTQKKGYICSYNLETLKYKRICEREAGVYNFMTYHDGKIYYVQHEYPDETNKHEKYIWSCDVKTGKTQKLFQYGTNEDSTYQGRAPLMVDEKGRMLFMNFISFDANARKESVIVFEYAELKKGAEIVEVARYTGPFESASYDTLQYSNGRLYFSALQEKIPYTHLWNGEEREATMMRDAIVYVDMNTGEVGKLPNDAIFGFAIAGDYLYYFPYDPKLYDYENEFGKQQTMIKNNGTVVQRNLKTGEEKVFPIKGNYSFGTSKTYYYRGRLFTHGVHPSENGVNGTPVEIDLISGEVREIDLTVLQTAI